MHTWRELIRKGLCWEAEHIPLPKGIASAVRAAVWKPKANLPRLENGERDPPENNDW